MNKKTIIDHYDNYEIFGKYYKGFFDKLGLLDFETISNNTGAFIYDKKILLRFFNRLVSIDINQRKLHYYSILGSKIILEEELDPFSNSIILHFLINADGKPLKNKWISYRELPGGLFYSSTISEVLNPLKEKYKNSGKDFINRVEKFGGKLCNEYINSAIIYPFERFPILLRFEEKDDEFEADIKVFFDSNASSYIKTDIIKVLIVYIVKKLLVEENL